MNESDIKFLIVEDEVFLAEYLSDMLKSMQFNQIKMEHSVNAAIMMIEQFKPDLVLLDIRMEGEYSGIELAEIINNRYHIPFIFITSHSDSAMLKKAMNLRPSGYLTKPFKKIDLYAAINIAQMSVLQKEDGYLVIKEGYSETKIRYSTISYAKSEGNYFTLICKDKTKYLVRQSLEWLESQIPEMKFVRCHRSYLVNIALANKLNSASIFIEGFIIPVSRGKMTEVRKKMKDL